MSMAVFSGNTWDDICSRTTIAFCRFRLVGSLKNRRFSWPMISRISICRDKEIAVLHSRFGDLGLGPARADGMVFGPADEPLSGGNKDFNFHTWGTMIVGGELIPTPVGSYSSLLLALTVASVAALGYRLMKRTYN